MSQPKRLEHTRSSEISLTKIDLDIYVAEASGRDPAAGDYGIQIAAGCHPEAGLKLYYQKGEVYANCMICGTTASVIKVATT